MDKWTSQTSDNDIKACCADFYSSDVVKWLLEDSYHPGGLLLTGRMGEYLDLGPGDVVLDVASGTGASAMSLADKFGCRVMGIDLSQANVDAANRTAQASEVSDLVSFITGDAESLPLEDARFDAVICECSFCIFPDQPAAAAEFARVLRPGGRFGISDLNLNTELPPELDSVLGSIICVAGAQTPAGYKEILSGAGLSVDAVHHYDDELLLLIASIRQKLIGATIIARTQEIALPDLDLDRALDTARWASNAMQRGELGYSLLVGRKPA